MTGLRKRSPFTSSLEDSGIKKISTILILSKYIGMMMGLGKRSQFTSSLEDSGNISDYST